MILLRFNLKQSKLCFSVCILIWVIVGFFIGQIRSLKVSRLTLKPRWKLIELAYLELRVAGQRSGVVCRLMVMRGTHWSPNCQDQSAHHIYIYGICGAQSAQLRISHVLPRRSCRPCSNSLVYLHTSLQESEIINVCEGVQSNSP